MTSNVKMPTDGIKMNEDLKDFLKDLNSGKWKQCRGKLGTKDDQYCFFGAMYEYFMEKNPGVVKKSFDKIGCAHYTIDSDSRYGFPHTQLLDFFGITKEWGRAISLLNDREKFSFKQIVKEIKKNVS